VDYFGAERLGLSQSIIDEGVQRLVHRLPDLHALIKTSFLSPENKERYLQVVQERFSRLA